MSKRNENEEQTEADELFVVDSGRARARDSAIDMEKFVDLLEKAEQAITQLGSNAVCISLPKLNAMLGTRYHNNNSLAYALKTGKATAPVLKEHGIYIGGKGRWNGPVEDQSIRFVKK